MKKAIILISLAALLPFSLSCSKKGASKSEIKSFIVKTIVGEVAESKSGALVKMWNEKIIIDKIGKINKSENYIPVKIRFNLTPEEASQIESRETVTEVNLKLFQNDFGEWQKIEPMTDQDAHNLSRIYISYIEGARVADPQATIGAIYNACKMYKQDNSGSYPSSLDILEKQEYLEIGKFTKDQWYFELILEGSDLKEIKATSTNKMKDGAGKTVIYHVKEGRFTGYGLP